MLIGQHRVSQTTFSLRFFKDCTSVPIFFYSGNWVVNLFNQALVNIGVGTVTHEGKRSRKLMLLQHTTVSRIDSKTFLHFTMSFFPASFMYIGYILIKNLFSNSLLKIPLKLLNHATMINPSKYLYLCYVQNNRKHCLMGMQNTPLQRYKGNKQPSNKV